MFWSKACQKAPDVLSASKPVVQAPGKQVICCRSQAELLEVTWESQLLYCSSKIGSAPTEPFLIDFHIIVLQHHTLVIL